MKEVEGKVAFITGGGSGMGLGMAKAFAAKGMKVILADLRPEALDEAMVYFKEKNLPAHAIHLDVTDREAYAAAADEAEDVFGKIHVLVNNAGVGTMGPIQNSTYKDWDFAVGVNLGGVINGIVTILPRILKHGEGGHVLSTSSTGGFSAVGGAGIYCTTKYAVAGLMETLATDLQGTGVGASVYFPGPVATNLPITSHSTRPDHLKNEGQPPMPPPRRPPFDQSTFMDPVEAGERILNGIMHNDLMIMTHPEFKKGIIARNEALLRAIPDEPPDPKRHEVLKNFGTIHYNPIYDGQRNVGPFKGSGDKG
jgi:NAD(P)-dependent dehydrogenase (short-subunit alcohol dehydrogenase family)